MKIKTSELIGAQLDWAVATSAKLTIIQIKGGFPYVPKYPTIGGQRFSPSTDWSQGGPIIERKRIGVNPRADRKLQENWSAQFYTGVENDLYVNEYGPTPLIAAMRCFCCAILGDEINIPEELCQSQNS